jgi:L-ascorbate metabolism protein UlaG (beta-lactamase superfamily)
VAAAEFLKAGLVLPMHYNTFEPIRQDPNAFVEKLATKGLRGKALAVGESVTV